MIKFLFFDLDGTLTDPKEGITRSVDYALRTVCDIQTADLDTLTPYIGPPLVDGFMENHHLDRATAERCRDAYRERYRTVGLLENRLFPEIPAVLQTLKQQGYTLCVATSKPEEFAVRILEHFDLAGYFTIISGATMDGRISTKQEVIQNTLRRCGNPSCSQVLMIGDRKHDIEGAHACDIAAIGVLYGFGSEAELQTAGADAIALSITSLPDIIAQMNPC
nr:HAD-IA family hydrolase [uncultured Butyricicoccus sp.]